MSLQGKHNRIRRMLAPDSAVFVGGSNLETAIANTRAKGFKGTIQVVNPFKQQVAGIRCLRSVAELVGVPDLAFVAVPKESVCENLAALSALGVSAAICNSAGFSETDGEGAGRQAELVEAIGSMPVLGPNCPGFINFLDNAAFTQDHFGDHDGVTSGVAVISNGGSYLSDVGCARRSLPVGYLIGAGNQASVSIADLLEAVLDDDRVVAINLYFESLEDVSTLSRAALRASRKNIPVVVVKGGRSASGGRAARTHTGSLAGDEVVTSALFERFGFIQVANPVQAIETLKMLVHTRRPNGNRVALATTSGSYAVMGGDAADAVGLSIPPLSDAAAERVRAFLPHFIQPSNPLDFSDGQFAGDEVQAEMFDHYLEQGYDLAVLLMSFPPSGGWEPESWYSAARQHARAARRHHLPAAFVNTVPEGLPEDARAEMIDEGMAPLMGIDHGLQAIADAVRFTSLNAKLSARADHHIVVESFALDTREARYLDEAQAKQRLAEAGIATPRSRVVGEESDLNGLDFPVALKVLSADILHKTELGGVELDIDSPVALRAALDAMQARLAVSAPTGTACRFLVEEMVTDVVGEVLIGVRSIGGVGQTMTVAIGGVTVELLGDAVTVSLPASEETLREALEQLKLFALLDGWRGRAGTEIIRLVETLACVAHLAEALGETLETLEINPLLVRRRGCVGPVCIAADAVLCLRDGS